MLTAPHFQKKLLAKSKALKAKKVAAAKALAKVRLDVRPPRARKSHSRTPRLSQKKLRVKALQAKAIAKKVGLIHSFS